MQETITLSEAALRIDAKQWCAEIERFIAARFADSFRTGIVVPISGGLDSSVTAALCIRAIGRDKVLGLMLPEQWGNPEALRYGRLIAAYLGIKTETFNISPVVRGIKASDFVLTLLSGRAYGKGILDWVMRKQGHTIRGDFRLFLTGRLEPSRRKLIVKINAKHRARLLAAYRFADEHNLMVVGAAHKTESMVGLFCKYGVDDCADLMPLKIIYRSHVLQLAEYLNIPGEILRRPPNPDILPGVTDKYISYFGMECDKLDLILFGLEKGLAIENIANQLGQEGNTVAEIREVVHLSENQRNHALAPVLT